MSFLSKIWKFLVSLFHVPEPKARSTVHKPYISYPNDIIIPLPGEADDTIMYCFPVKGDYDKMMAVANQLYNFGLEDQPLRYFPLTTEMMLVISKINKAQSLNKSYDRAGILSETGVQIFMPLAECTQNDRKEWVAQRIVAGIPYILVDNPFSMAIGREHIGFPKSIGKFQFPESPENADLFTVSTFGFKKYDKNKPETAAYHPWLKVGKVSNHQGGENSWNSGGHAWEEVKKVFNHIPKEKDFKEGLPFIIHELEDLSKGEIPLIFLKQFRSIEVPDNACYQAVVEGGSFLKKFHSGWFLGGEYEVSFEDFASFPIKSELGLEDTILVKHPFWIKADLMFGTGREVWRAK